MAVEFGPKTNREFDKSRENVGAMEAEMSKVTRALQISERLQARIDMLSDEYKSLDGFIGKRKEELGKLSADASADIRFKKLLEKDIKDAEDKKKEVKEDSDKLSKKIQYRRAEQKACKDKLEAAQKVVDDKINEVMKNDPDVAKYVREKVTAKLEEDRDAALEKRIELRNKVASMKALRNACSEDKDLKNKVNDLLNYKLWTEEDKIRQKRGQKIDEARAKKIKSGQDRLTSDIKQLIQDKNLNFSMYDIDVLYDNAISIHDKKRDMNAIMLDYSFMSAEKVTNKLFVENEQRVQDTRNAYYNYIKGEMVSDALAKNAEIEAKKAEAEAKVKKEGTTEKTTADAGETKGKARDDDDDETEKKKKGLFARMGESLKKFFSRFRKGNDEVKEIEAPKPKVADIDEQAKEFRKSLIDASHRNLYDRDARVQYKVQQELKKAQSNTKEDPTITRVDLDDDDDRER